MRIIAGKWRSRRLIRPQTEATRPMPDRVKEAIFSMLGARYESPGGLPPLHVADVFAGSGAMGLEALSRGAAHCTFFERSREALEALRKNIDTLGAGSESTLITRDAWRAARRNTNGKPFDLIFLDPPYVDSLDTSSQGAVARYLAEVARRLDAPVVVFHHPASVEITPEAVAPWGVNERRTFGSNGITILNP